jgi:hypothetical protein
LHPPLRGIEGPGHSCTRNPTFDIVVVIDRETDLLKVVHTLGPGRSLSDFLNGGGGAGR